MKFNVCMPYYQNPGMLNAASGDLGCYPKELRDQFRFVIVDDCSRRSQPRRWSGESDIPAEVWLFRIEKDIPWGWPAAKNIAMHEIPDGNRPWSRTSIIC